MIGIKEAETANFLLSKCLSQTKIWPAFTMYVETLKILCDHL